MNILFKHRSPSTDFTFNVTEKPEVPGLVEVDLYTDKKFVQKTKPIARIKLYHSRFSGLRASWLLPILVPTMTAPICQMDNGLAVAP